MSTAGEPAGAGSPPLPEQPTAPYLDAVVAYGFRGSGRFHVPGHKGGAGADPGLRHALGDDALMVDIPQDIRGIDAGPSPTPYERAEALAADAYGAQRTWFLTNGATQGRPGHLRPRHTPVAPMGIPGVNAIIAVASGKGGVGKSTVAVNLALGLSRLGLRTGLLDADIYGPSVPRLLDIREKPQTDGRKLIPIAKLGIKAMSIGFLVTEDQAMIWRGPMVQSALTQMMNDVVWAPLDVLVIDMPPGTGDAQLTIAQRVPLKGAVIVSTPQDIALIDAREGITMFNRTQIPVLGVVENMSVFVCENCGHESHIFGHGGARATAEKLGVPFLGEVPLMPKIRETSDAGTPIVDYNPTGPEARAFLAIAEQVAKAIAAPARAAPKIVIE
jgi:ATP-binding protein involved in chromosome partitioning